MIPSAAPFGGVGRSGMGAYHGKAGFDAFSHYRSVVGTDLPFSITGRAAPPFSGSTPSRRWFRSPDGANRTRRRLGSADDSLAAFAHWCTILVSAILDGSSMHPGAAGSLPCSLDAVMSSMRSAGSGGYPGRADRRQG